MSREPIEDVVTDSQPSRPPRCPRCRSTNLERRPPAEGDRYRCLDCSAIATAMACHDTLAPGEEPPPREHWTTRLAEESGWVG